MARRLTLVLAVLLLGVIGTRSGLAQPVPPTNTPTATRTPTNTPTATNTTTPGPTQILNPAGCDDDTDDNGGGDPPESGGFWLLGTAGTAPLAGWVSHECVRGGAGVIGCDTSSGGLKWTARSTHHWNYHICDADSNYLAHAIMAGPVSKWFRGTSHPPFSNRWPWTWLSFDDLWSETVEIQGVQGRYYTCVQGSAPFPCWRYDPRNSIYWVDTGDVSPGSTIPLVPNQSWAVIVSSWVQETPTPTITPVPVEVPFHAWGYPVCGGIQAANLFDHTFATGNQIPNWISPNWNTHTIYSNENWEESTWQDGHDGVDVSRYGYNTESGDLPDEFKGVANVDSQSRPVFAVQNGRVIHAGLDKISAGATYGSCYDITGQSWFGSTMIEVKHNGAEGAEYLGLDAVMVQPGQAVAKGQLIATMGASGNMNAGTLHVSALRYGPIGPYKDFPVFDPYGWDRDHGGYYPQPMDYRSDPWYKLNGIVSQRVWLPGGPPDPLGCPVACSEDVTVIDDSDPGFSCPGCPASEASYGINDESIFMNPSGTHTQNTRARWESGLSPGTYAVAAYIPARANRPVAVPVLAARYMAGLKVVQVSQMSADVAGWTFLGIFNYEVEPYMELSDAAFDLNGGWVDPDDCSYLAIDAMAFQPICQWPNVGSGRLTLGTSVPPPTVPVPTPCSFPPCRTPTPGAPPSFPGGGG